MKAWTSVYYSFGVVAIAFLLVFYAFLEPPYLSYGNLPFPVTKAQLRGGDFVPVVVNRCNSSGRTRVYQLSHALVRHDGSQIVLPPSLAPIDPGCSTSISAVTEIPKGTPAGFYKLTGNSEVHATIRSTVVHWETQFFEVLE